MGRLCSIQVRRTWGPLYRKLADRKSALLVHFSSGSIRCPLVAGQLAMHWRELSNLPRCRELAYSHRSLLKDAIMFYLAALVPIEANDVKKGAF